jgi:hypothetical protein
MLEDLQWLVDSFYTLEFKHDHDITERVIFPMSNSESRGIEDRFVRFMMMVQKNVCNLYRLMVIVPPKLISTEDFYSFNVMPCMELDLK